MNRTHMFATHRGRATWAAVTLAALAIAAPARFAPAAELAQKRFDLAPNPTFMRCLAAFPDDPARAPRATVFVKRGRLNDRLDIQLRYFRPGLEFALFSLERTIFLADGRRDPDSVGFGFAWFQSMLEVKNANRSGASIRTILADRTFGLNPTLELKPANALHLGFWFVDPADAEPCGFDGPPTPFNAAHQAGPLAMVSLPDATTNLGPLCLTPDFSTDPVGCAVDD